MDENRDRSFSIDDIGKGSVPSLIPGTRVAVNTNALGIPEMMDFLKGMRHAVITFEGESYLFPKTFIFTNDRGESFVADLSIEPYATSERCPFLLSDIDKRKAEKQRRLLNVKMFTILTDRVSFIIPPPKPISAQPKPVIAPPKPAPPLPPKAAPYIVPSPRKSSARRKLF